MIAGYGIALPLLAQVPPVGRVLQRLAVVGPPAGLIPAFAASLLTYELYPWDFAGEVVELTVGLGFLFAAVMRAHELRGEARAGVRRSAAAPVALLGALALGLGLASGALGGRWIAKLFVEQVVVASSSVLSPAVLTFTFGISALAWLVVNGVPIAHFLRPQPSGPTVKPASGPQLQPTLGTVQAALARVADRVP